MASASRLRRGSVVVNGAAALIAWGMFLVLLPFASGAPESTMATADRLTYALRLAVWPAALTLAMVTAVALTRFHTNAFDPIKDTESRLYRINQRVLANTVEQTVIFLPCFLALATVLPAGRLGALKLVVGLFVTARLVFWAGYLRHPYLRAPGMSATWNVNAGMILYIAWQAIT